MSSEKRKYELKARAESQQATRNRIAQAASELHEQKGVAATTVADIARRAGVQRLTVYNHFADLSDLLPACSAHWLSLHPQPDVSSAFAREDPQERVRAALGAFYPWYRETARMQAHAYGDRSTVPALDDFMAETTDAALAELASGLAAGFGLRGKRARRIRALIRVALEFWTWQRLADEGLTDGAAADLMAASVAAQAGRTAPALDPAEQAELHAVR